MFCTTRGPMTTRPLVPLGLWRPNRRHCSYTNSPSDRITNKVQYIICGPGSVVSIVTGYGLDGPGTGSRWGVRFSATVQTGPGAHPASCTMGTGSFPGVKSGQGVTLTPHLLLVPLVMKEQSYTSTPPYGPYGLYRASVPVQGCTLLTLYNIQGEHKVFPWLQTFLTRKLRGIQTYFFFKM